jgi:hypothetical protein
VLGTLAGAVHLGNLGGGVALVLSFGESVSHIILSVVVREVGGKGLGWLLRDGMLRGGVGCCWPWAAMVVGCHISTISQFCNMPFIARDILSI